MDWFELFLVIIGAVLGFVLSILTIIIQNIMDRNGKINVFSKISVHRESEIKAGYMINTDKKRILAIPMIIELQNTTNSTRVIRDLCLYLYNDKEYVDKMIQLTREVNRKNEYYYGDNGSYSFVLLANSIQKYTLLFALNADDLIAFNRIKMCYFDESNKLFGAILIDEVNGNDPNLEIDYSSEYKLLDFKKIRKK